MSIFLCVIPPSLAKKQTRLTKVRNFITLRDKDNNLLTAHYRLYKAKAFGRIICGKVRLPCGSLLAPKGVGGGVEVDILPCAVDKEDKNGLAVERCPDEQQWNDNKLCYCVLKGFDRYVSLVLPKETNLFVGKHRIAIDSRFISVRQK